MRARRSGLAALAIVVALPTLAACSGGGKKTPVPPTPAPTVLPSADRIRLHQTRLGAPEACLTDAYCAAGLSRVYGIDLGDRTLALADPVATVGALNAGAIDVAALPRSTAGLSRLAVTPLTDDRQLNPATNVIPVVAAAAAKTLLPALNSISAKFDQAGLDALEQSLAGGTSPDQAATAWLSGHGFVHSTPPPAGPVVTLAVPSGGEDAALADIYAGALAAGGDTVKLDTLDGGTTDVLDALATGGANVAVEHLAPLLEYVDGFAGLASADESRTLAVLHTYLADLQLVAGTPAAAKTGVVFALNPAVARALGVTTLSDLGRASGAHLPPSTTTSASPASTTTTTTAAPTSSPPVGPTLGVGANGTAVIALQQKLIALGYHATPTATFDEGTRRAMVGFQSDHGLVTDGVDDANTQRALALAKPTTHPGTAPGPGDLGSVAPPPGTPGTIYLAFAGGPGPATAQILQLLGRRSAAATFFADDAAINRHADTLKSLIAGNGVGTSTPPHDTTSPVAEDVLMRKGNEGREDLATAIGKTSNCMLLPYGALDDATARNAAGRGLKPVVWDVDPQDWRHPGADVIAADVIDNAHAGSIVLLHDGGGDRTQTVAAVSAILDTLGGRGFTFSAIPDCVVGQPGATPAP